MSNLETLFLRWVLRDVFSTMQGTRNPIQNRKCFLSAAVERGFRDHVVVYLSQATHILNLQ